MYLQKIKKEKKTQLLVGVDVVNIILLYRNGYTRREYSKKDMNSVGFCRD